MVLVRYVGPSSGTRHSGYDLKVGGIYFALCIYVSQNPKEEYLLRDSDPLLDYKKSVSRFGVVDGMGLVFQVPSTLFEIVDSKISSRWKIKVYGDGGFLLSPERFHDPYFWDKVTNFEMDELSAVDEEIKRMEIEYNYKVISGTD